MTDLDNYCEKLIAQNTQLRKEWRIVKKENEILKEKNTKYKRIFKADFQYRNYWFNKYAKLFNKTKI